MLRTTLKPLNFCLLSAVLSLGMGRLGAQEDVPNAPRLKEQNQEPAPLVDEPPVKFWESFQGYRVNTSATLVLLGHPYTAIALRLAAGDVDNPLASILGTEWQFFNDEAAPLPDPLLQEIRDGTPLPDFSGKEPLRKDEWAFYWLLNRALEQANVTPLENFKKSAEENKYVQFTHLWTDPERYRGKVVLVRGQLLMLRQYPAPRPAQKQGIRFVYEGWIKGPTKGTNPFWAIFTEPPAGLEPFEMTDGKARPDVTFYGYFLKKQRYTAANSERVTPYLVGRTLVVASTPVQSGTEEQPFARFMVFAVAGSVLALTAVAFAFSLWFRRGDDRIRSRISALREKHGLDFQDTTPAPTEPQPLPHEPGSPKR
jgi:hypothetical protein